jgi:hypothetical protein
MQAVLQPQSLHKAACSYPCRHQRSQQQQQQRMLAMWKLRAGHGMSLSWVQRQRQLACHQDNTLRLRLLRQPAGADVLRVRPSWLHTRSRKPPKLMASLQAARPVP